MPAADARASIPILRLNQTTTPHPTQIIPGARAMGLKVQAHAFQGYWEDIGTIEAFYNANLALANPGNSDFSFYDKDAPIYTMSRFLPPSKVVDSEVRK